MAASVDVRVAAGEPLGVGLEPCADRLGARVQRLMTVGDGNPGPCQLAGVRPGMELVSVNAVDVTGLRFATIVRNYAGAATARVLRFREPEATEATPSVPPLPPRLAWAEEPSGAQEHSPIVQRALGLWERLPTPQRTYDGIRQRLVAEFGEAAVHAEQACLPACLPAVGARRGDAREAERQHSAA